MNTFQAFFLVLFGTLIEKIALILTLALGLFYVVFMQKTKKLSETDWTNLFETLDFPTFYKKFSLLYCLSFGAVAFGLYCSVFAMDISFPLAYTACVSSFSFIYLFFRHKKFKSVFADYFVQWKADTLSKMAQ